MNELNNQPATSGNMVNSQGEVVNVVDMLVTDTATPMAYDQEKAIDILNRTPAKSGHYVASDGKVYNIVDLLSQAQAGVTSSTVPTGNGSNVQAELETLGTGLGNLAEEVDIIKNDVGDLGDIQNQLANSTSKARFHYVKTIHPTNGSFEIDLSENKDYCLDCKFILSQSGTDIYAQFSKDGVTYDTGTNYSNRLDHRSTDLDVTEVISQENDTGFIFNYNGVPSGLVNLYIDVVRGNSYFQPFVRSTLEYMESSGTAEYVEHIGGYKSYGCKKMKVYLSQGTFNDLNNVESHIDVYERI